MSVGQRCGPYEILESIGRGGMAEVFRARYRGAAGADREVVLKRILPFPEAERASIEQLFVAEARLALQLTHGNIVQVYDFGEEDGQHYLAMEFVEGVTLSSLVDLAKKQGLQVLPPALAALLLVEICKGLHYAHTRNDRTGTPLHIVHRDVCPDNVLVGFDGQVKVADFGIARASMPGRERTEPGIYRGKLSYSAPEQMRADAIDARTDVYACGILLWKLVAGTNPQAELAVKLAMGTVELPEPPVDLMGKELAAIVKSATQAEPDRRPRSAQDLQLQLQAWLRTSDVPHPDTAIARFVQWARGEPQADSTLTEWLESSIAATPSKSHRELAATVSARREQETKLSAPAPSTKLATRPARLGAALGIGVVATICTVFAISLNEEAEAPSDPTPIVVTPVQPPPVAKRVASPSSAPGEPEAPAPQTLPTFASGVPAVFVVTSELHGLELSRVGVPVKATSNDWSFRLQGRSGAEPLFFAPLDGDSRALRVLTSKWQRIEAMSGRLFALTPPGWKAYDPDLDLHYGRSSRGTVTELPAAAVKHVLTDSLIPLDGHRFLLDGLNPKKRYRVTSTELAPGASGPVVVTASGLMRVPPTLSIPGPPQQALLLPGRSLEVKNATGLSVTLPYFPDSPAMRVQVSVEEPGPTIVVDRNSAEARRLDAQLAATPSRSVTQPSLTSDTGLVFNSASVEGLINVGVAQMARHRPDLAIPWFERCLVKNPGNPECSNLLDRAKEKVAAGDIRR